MLKPDNILLCWNNYLIHSYPDDEPFTVKMVILNGQSNLTPLDQTKCDKNGAFLAGV